MTESARKPKKTAHRNNFMRGAGRVLVLSPRREYRIPQRGDFARDARMLRADFAAVARDMDYTIRNHGEGQQNTD